MRASPFALYAKLVTYEFRWRMRHLAVTDADPLTAGEISALLSFASAMALFPRGAEGARGNYRALAYDIATRLATVFSDAALVRSSTSYLLARLGNFPGVDLLRRSSAAPKGPLNFLLALEAVNRSIENTVSLSRENKTQLTDFQYELFADLRRQEPLSISAPTSAGKSFVLALDIARRLWESAGLTIIYLVPTRALIRQVMRDLVERLRALDVASVAVLAAPTALPRDPDRVGTVYVLTPERLMTLLFGPSAVHIDALYVDEAQEIEDGERGIVLHTAVSIALRRFPKMATVFSSPLTANPEFLHSEFQLEGTGRSLREHESPVSQTLLFLSRAGDRDNNVNVEALIAGHILQIAKPTVPFRFAGVIPRLAKTAVHFTDEGETSIVYCNRARDAEQAAQIIAGQVAGVGEPPLKSVNGMWVEYRTVPSSRANVTWRTMRRQD